MLEMSDDGEFVYAPQLIDENRDIIVIEQVQGLWPRGTSINFDVMSLLTSSSLNNSLG